MSQRKPVIHFWILCSLLTSMVLLPVSKVALGALSDEEFQVNSTPLRIVFYADDPVNGADESAPAVAMDNQGDFVVVWAQRESGNSVFFDIEGQRFDNNS